LELTKQIWRKIHADAQIHDGDARPPGTDQIYTLTKTSRGPDHLESRSREHAYQALEHDRMVVDEDHRGSWASHHTTALRTVPLPGLPRTTSVPPTRSSRRFN